MVLSLFEGLDKLLVWLVLPLALLAGVLFYLGQGVTDVSVQSFEIDGLQQVRADSFTFRGVLAVRNPSVLPVPVESVRYDVSLNETGRLLANGSVEPFTLEPGVTRSSFSQRVRWVPGASRVDGLLRRGAWVRVNGTVFIDLPVIGSHEAPFETYVSIRQFLSQPDLALV